MRSKKNPRAEDPWVFEVKFDVKTYSDSFSDETG
jgi:hypothetical protein